VKIGDRVDRYRAIEDARGRPLIVYATSTRQNAHGMMAGDAVREFIDQIDAVSGGSAVDILLHSTGGDPLVAWKLMSVLRERFESVSVLVPFMAFSAATLFSLGADEIVMHPHASLGPIDPQITIKLPDGTQRQFAFEDVGAFLRFVTAEVGVTEQAHVSSVIEKLFAVVDPVHIGAAKRASELSTDVGERLLQIHMQGDEEREAARTIAERLNKSFFAHGDAVSRSRARSLHLKIADNDPKLERLLWEAFLGIEDYMELRKPFHPLQHFIATGGAATLAPKAPLNLPQNAPAQLVQAAWNQAAQDALNALAQPAVEVGYSIVNAIIESARTASEFRTSGVLTAARIAGGEIQLAATDRETQWKPVAVPKKK
jgi:hypothetical protein